MSGYILRTVIIHVACWVQGSAFDGTKPLISLRHSDIYLRRTLSAVCAKLHHFTYSQPDLCHICYLRFGRSETDHPQQRSSTTFATRTIPGQPSPSPPSTGMSSTINQISEDASESQRCPRSLTLLYYGNPTSGRACHIRDPYHHNVEAGRKDSLELAGSAEKPMLARKACTVLPTARHKVNIKILGRSPFIHTLLPSSKTSTPG